MAKDDKKITLTITKEDAEILKELKQKYLIDKDVDLLRASLFYYIAYLKTDYPILRITKEQLSNYLQEYKSVKT